MLLLIIINKLEKLLTCIHVIYLNKCNTILKNKDNFLITPELVLCINETYLNYVGLFV